MKWIDDLFDKPGAFIKKFAKTYLKIVFVLYIILCAAAVIVGIGVAVDADFFALFFAIAIGGFIVFTIAFFLEILPAILLYVVGKLSDDVASIKNSTGAVAGAGQSQYNYDDDISGQLPEL